MTALDSADPQFILMFRTSGGTIVSIYLQKLAQGCLVALTPDLDYEIVDRSVRGSTEEVRYRVVPRNGTFPDARVDAF